MKNIRLLHLGLNSPSSFTSRFCSCAASECLSYSGDFTAKHSVSASLTLERNKMFLLYEASLVNPLWIYFKNHLNPVFLESDQSDCVTDFKPNVCIQAELKAKGRTAFPAPTEQLKVALVSIKVVMFEQWLEDINNIFFTMELPQLWRLKSCEVYVKQGLWQ